ncbi:MAG TPA: hypothetical protein VN969_22340 [Streptosporangiaceae bacterium]|nr:hypothetical protein [Streptosporangiaceae bacterium]
MADDERYVAKLVDHLDAQGLDAGLRLAEFAAARGLPSGAPVPTFSGALTIVLPEGVLALLRHVPGNPRWPWEWVTECLGTVAMRGRSGSRRQPSDDLAHPR